MARLRALDLAEELQLDIVRGGHWQCLMRARRGAAGQLGAGDARSGCQLQHGRINCAATQARMDPHRGPLSCVDGAYHGADAAAGGITTSKNS